MRKRYGGCSTQRPARASATPPRERGRRSFPPGVHDGIGEEIGRRGKEFGVNTGRKRRCGWFDAMLVRQTVRTCGINGLALTKLDILDGFDTIEGCVGVRLGRK